MRDYENCVITSRKEDQISKFDFPFKERDALDEAYYKRYDLKETAYKQKWQPIQQTIFDPNADWFPDMMFLPGFELFFMLPDSAVVTRRQLARLKKCMHALGEKEFVIIENEPLFKVVVKSCFPKAEPIRLKYPSTLTYTQFLDGGTDVVITVGGRMIDWRGYFVFSESGQWGLYSPAVDEKEDFATYILGFRKEVAPLFTEQFKNFNTEEEKKYILETCFPHMPAYQQYDTYLR